MIALEVDAPDAAALNTARRFGTACLPGDHGRPAIGRRAHARVELFSGDNADPVGRETLVGRTMIVEQAGGDGGIRTLEALSGLLI